MRSPSQLQVLLQKIPGHVPLITDGELAAMLELVPSGFLARHLHAPLLAEAWLRRWLYIGEWHEPQEFTGTLARLTPTFEKGFKDHAKSWRHLRDEGDPLPPAEPPKAEVKGDELAVWEVFWHRMLNFAYADGVLALVLEENDGKQPAEAVAVAFRLNQTDEIRDARQNRLVSWSNAVGYLRDGFYQHPLGADLYGEVTADLPLTGESVTLPVLLARDRERGGTMPEFHPLDMLATGGFRLGRLEEVGGLNAKEALAKRMGCKWFIRPANRPGLELGDGAFRKDDGIEHVLAKTAQLLDPGACTLPLARRALAICRRRVESSGVSTSEAASAFFRLTRNRPLFRKNPEREECQRVLRKAASRAGEGRVANLDKDIELHLESYRRRAFYGRDSILTQMQTFLRGRGGVLLVTGEADRGKTALMVKVLDHVPPDRMVFRHFFVLNQPSTRDVDAFEAHLRLFLSAVLGDKCNERDTLSVMMETLGEQTNAPKVVLILDGLDEADGSVDASFLQGLPPCVHVIAAARSSDVGQPEGYLTTWEQAATQTVDVVALDPKQEEDDSAIRDWLDGLKSPELRRLGSNGAFRTLLLQRSGSPRWIANVLDDLAAKPKELAKNWEACIRAVPSNYVELIQEQYLRLKNSPNLTYDHRRLLALLCAAEGPLTEPEIEAILGDVPNLPPVCERWVSSQSGSLVIQTREIREALRSLGETLPWQDQEKQLLKFCERWAEHGKPYALRYYATHLAVDKKWKEIAELVLSDTFRAKITECLPDEPDLPVRLLRGAFERAVLSDDWEGTALLMLARVELRRRVFDLSSLAKSSPDESAASAAKILDRADPARATLLRLVQAWALVLHSRPQFEQEAVREQVSSTRLVMLSGLEADVASALLARVFAPDDQRLAGIARRLLDEEARLELVRNLAALKTGPCFIGARRILDTLPRSGRRAANMVFDHAVTSLSVALAEAGDWDQSLSLIEPLLPRQQSLNLVQLGKVASAQSSLPRLADVRARMDRLVNACAPNMHEFNAQGGSKGWKGTPDDRSICLGNKLQLEAWNAVVEAPGNVTGTWRSITDKANELANNKELHLRPRFHALHGIAQAILAAAQIPRLAFLGKRPLHGHDAFLLSALWNAWNAWQDMDKDVNNTDKAVAHNLAALVHLAEDIQRQHPQAASELPGTIVRWRDLLRERGDNLSPDDREDLWIRIAADNCESSNFDRGQTMLAIRNLSDRQHSGRAIGWLVRRLQKEHMWRLVRSITGGSRSLEPSIRLAYGLATMDAMPKKALGQLLRSCLPGRRRDSVQVGILKAHLAAAGRPEDRDSRRLCFEKAKMMVIAHRNIHFTLEVAKAAHKAGDNQTRDDLLTQANRTATDMWDTARRGIRQRHGETEHLRQADYDKTVETLCALALTIFDLRLAGHSELRSPQSLLEGALEIARDRVPGISTRTGALAEVAEAAARMGLWGFAETVLNGMLEFVDKLPEQFGERRIRFERQTCLAELVLGYFKAPGFANRAMALKPRLLRAVGVVEGERGEIAKANRIREPVVLHALARLLVHENRLKDAWPLLRRIRNAATRAKAARNVAIELAHRGRWQHAVGVAGLIERSEFKQQYLHRVVRAVATSKNIKPHERRLAFVELLWNCCEGIDAVCPALAHLVECQPETASPIAQALIWWESLGAEKPPEPPNAVPSQP